MPDRLGDWFGPIEAVLDGFAAGARDTGVVARLEPDFIRDFDLEHAGDVLQVALKYAGRGAVSVNSAGSERPPSRGTPTSSAGRSRQGCHRPRMPASGPDRENVWATLEHLAPARIGHGVRSVDDPRLVAHLADLGIPLEACPTSNVATGVFASLAEHPFPRLRDSGVVVTLNSDDPAMLGSCGRATSSAWRARYSATTTRDLADIARAGVRASFADDDH